MAAEQNFQLTMMLTIEFSRRLAYIGGVVTPLAETIRTWSTWQETPANYFDDYLLGAFLIFGAWRTGSNVHEGQRLAPPLVREIPASIGARAE